MVEMGKAINKTTKTFKKCTWSSPIANSWQCSTSQRSSPRFVFQTRSLEDRFIFLLFVELWGYLEDLRKQHNNMFQICMPGQVMLFLSNPKDIEVSTATDIDGPS